MAFYLLLNVMLLISIPAQGGNLQVSGGADLRYGNIEIRKNEFEIEGLFLNLRKVFSDKKGDRLIAVGQMDFDNNFEKVRPYQIYLQYKGPLGKWNIRMGHYILPFGLLSDYDTERLLLQTIEHLNLGIKLDTWIELLGFLGDFDYAISLSQGVGRNRLTDVDSNKLVIGKIGWRGEDLTIGLSGLIGKVLTEENSTIRNDIGSNSLYKKRLGIDLTKYSGPLILRGEISIGEDNSQIVEGGLLKADYALTPKLETNLKYAHWQREAPTKVGLPLHGSSRNFIGVGFSYELYKGLFIRVADEYQFGKEKENVATFQIYYEFAKQF